MNPADVILSYRRHMRSFWQHRASDNHDMAATCWRLAKWEAKTIRGNQRMAEIIAAAYARQAGR